MHVFSVENFQIKRQQYRITPKEPIKSIMRHASSLAVFKQRLKTFLFYRSLL